MKRVGYILLFLIIVLSSCTPAGSGFSDTPTSGTIKVAIDETLAPLMEQEINVFESTYPKATIIPEYRSEGEVFELLMNDSLNMAIATRDYTIEEKRSLKAKYNVRSYCLAIDAIALIINKSNTDSMLTVGQVKDILTGKIKSWKDINPKSELDELLLTFDNNKSSTVRFALDSICKGEPFSNENLYAQGTNQKVIDFVAESPGAIGVIGASWLGNKADTTNLSFNDRITVVSLARDRSNMYYKPYQAYMALGQYPLVRQVYVLDTSSRNGLAKGFSGFLSNDNGQLIVLKSGMIPRLRQARVKQVHINNRAIK